MAAPTRYVPSYDFTAFQTSNPSTPLPADRVEIENNNIQTTTDEIIDNLALIQRSDGQLSNNSVGIDQIKSEVSLGLNAVSTWTTGVNYVANDGVYQGNNVYRCLVAHQAGVFSTDLAALKWELIVDYDQFVNAAEAARDAAIVAQGAAETAETNAETAETNAETAETNAEAAETAAVVAQGAAELAKTQTEALIQQIGTVDIVNVTNSDSPVAIGSSNLKAFFSVDTSGGNVVFNIDATLSEPFSFRVKKETSDSNTITVNTQATETFFDGTTSKTISAIGGIDCQLDTSTSPDTWKTVSFGASAGENKKQQFTRTGTDFTTGTTSLTLTNTPIAPSSAGLRMSIDGVDQHSDAFTYAPDTGVVTFDALDSTEKSIEFKWSSGTIATGVTGDGTVSLIKLATGLFISALSEVLTTTTNKIARISDLFDYVEQRVPPETQVVAWGKINQTGTQALVESYGVDSIADAGNGLTTVTLSDAMDSVNFIVMVTTSDSTGNLSNATLRNQTGFTRTTTQFQIKNTNNAGTATDTDDLHFVVYGRKA